MKPILRLPDFSERDRQIAARRKPFARPVLHDPQFRCRLILPDFPRNTQRLFAAGAESVERNLTLTRNQGGYMTPVGSTPAQVSDASDPRSLAGTLSTTTAVRRQTQ